MTTSQFPAAALLDFQKRVAAQQKEPTPCRAQTQTRLGHFAERIVAQPDQDHLHESGQPTNESPVMPHLDAAAADSGHPSTAPEPRTLLHSVQSLRTQVVQSSQYRFRHGVHHSSRANDESWSIAFLYPTFQYRNVASNRAFANELNQPIQHHSRRIDRQCMSREPFVYDRQSVARLQSE